MISTLTIAIPTKGITDPAFAVALRLLDIPAEQYSVIYVEGADVAHARNLLAEKAMEVADYIFMVDDDILPPINAIAQLAKHEKDIITGLYFAKQEPHFPQIFLKNEEVANRYDAIQEYKKDSLIEVDSCGGGCLLIKSDVFRKIKKPYFQYIPKGEDHPRKGEDFYFCEKVRDAGIKIFADTSVICKHIGKKYITAEHWNISLEHLKALKEKMGEEKFNEWKKQFHE